MLWSPLFDVILGLILVEAVLIVLWLRSRAHLTLLPAALCFLASGALVMAALRFSLVAPGHDLLICALVGLSFPAHLAALWLAWRHVSKPPAK